MIHLNGGKHVEENSFMQSSQVHVFSLNDVPIGVRRKKEAKFKIEVLGVRKEKGGQLVFDDNVKKKKKVKFGKLKLNDALKVFESLPKNYPRKLHDKEEYITFIVDGKLHIVLTEEEASKKYMIAALTFIGYPLIRFAILEEASYEEALEAIKRFYNEEDFLYNTFYAKEKYLEKLWVERGLCVARMPGGISFEEEDYDRIHGLELFVDDNDGLYLYIHGGDYLLMYVPPGPYGIFSLPWSSIVEVKYEPRRDGVGLFEVRYLNEKGKKRRLKLYTWLEGDGDRLYSILLSKVPGRVKK